jgi:2-polyprenyl-6-hydroxyphenyl methylase/3-demethylubiquinone-9 3-methyltransferase
MTLKFSEISTMSMNNTDINQQEIHKFNQLSAEWWDTRGPLATLHAINPCRLGFITERVALTPDTRILDIGCGGGILTESLARTGASVTGVDMAPELINIARAHAESQNLDIDYQAISSQALAAVAPGQYDVVTCMELLEHVSDPGELIQDAATLTKPGGTLFFSTLNRTWQSYLQAILSAEYLLKLLPVHTHHYDQFIRPAELDAWARNAGLTLQTLSGMSYNPLTQHASLTPSVNVNYLASYRK